ncbi:kinesin domain-containing protein [Lactarius indigo]|nr:kinesin domain-containing protein [Lactarius indigo]
MAPSSSPGSSTTSVQVALRIRPVTPQDAVNIPARFQRTVIHATTTTSVSVDVTTSAPATPGASTATAPPSPSPVVNAKKQHFTFDQVHGQDTTQHALFTATAQPLITRFLEGFNCTILAYGQTSSGKTFTMTGVDLDADPLDPTNGIGIIPRAVSAIFQRARAIKEERGGAWSCSIKGSFIEIYNEDLIDLLVDDGSGARREVQIREGKDGSIIWGGLREVQVKNATEVMNLIRQGTSIRRTNETEMNAQSSRSHAIFSLTLVQRKYSGTGVPPRSSSPLPLNGRSPSRLARPGSMLAGPSGNRVSSPTFGRPGTPGIPSAMGRTSVFRPASSLGHHDARGSLDDDSGDWVTVVSKFHFVDLAGSERLKRTAAAGDRIKEGISINSGLLALGNVISALGDPSRAKSHTASHVPYRDSKLTRLLQDSLGGNAHTLMIACVSPAEWNAAETVNTLKYANRARNIKNRATINEKEEGWDDVEWLQGMVTRLRKELKAIKEGGSLNGYPSELETGRTIPVESAASKGMLANYNEMKNNYEELREKYVARNEELTRLRKEHGEWHRASSSSGTVTGMSKYEEIVGPPELSLNRAALRHTNDLVEEKDEELNQTTERKVAAELYIEELRARLVKLTEREASTEAYVHDLEEKMRQYDESNISSSESMSDLKRELSRFKEAESHSAKYITDLEVRLAKSDESLLALREHVEKLELECERRQAEARVLQERLEGLKKDGQSWRTDLEERERRVLELETKMEEWQAKKKEAGEAWERLGNMASEVQQERNRLDVDLAKVATSSSNSASGTSTPKESELALENQLVSLQQAHAATLADLSSVTAKYRDALHEISDLAAQIQEAKLSNASLTDPSERSVDSGTHRRRMTGGRMKESNDNSISSTGRRHFFHHAASTESLHSRSLSQSVSLSQELSSARSRKASFSSHGTSSPTQSPHRPTLSISLPALGVSPNERSAASLEKEIMRLQDVLKEREQEIAHLEISLKEKETLTPSTPNIQSTTNSPSTFLSPRTINQFDEIKTVLQNGSDGADVTTNSESDESLDRLNELMRAMAQKESQHRETIETLNEELGQLRRQHDELTVLSNNQTINMSNELGSLQSKHEDCLARLEEVEQRKVELEKSVEQAKVDHTLAVEQLRLDHEQLLRAKVQEVNELVARLEEEHSSSVTSLQEQLREASSALEKSHKDHAEAFGRLQAEHEDELRRRLGEATAALSAAREAHEATLHETQVRHEEILKQKDDEMAKTEEEYYNGLVKLRTQHDTALEHQAAQAKIMLERLREDHNAELRVAELARDGLRSESQTAQADAINDIRNEHAATLAKKEATFADDLEKLKSTHAAALSEAQEEHKKDLERVQQAFVKAQAEYKESSSRSREQFEASLLALKEQQTAILQEVELGHQREIATLKSSHQVAIDTLASQAEQDCSNLRQLHDREREEILDAREKALTELTANLETQHDRAMVDALAKAEQERFVLIKAHQDRFMSSQVEHEEAISSEIRNLRGKLENDLQEALAKTRDEHATLIQDHGEQLAAIRMEHDRSLADLNAALKTEEENRRKASELARLQIDKLRADAKEDLEKATKELEMKHQQELEVAHKNCELLTEELASHKLATKEYLIAREQTRTAHEDALNKQSEIIVSLHQDLSEAHNEREELAKEVESLKAQLGTTRGEQVDLIKEASNRDSLVGELEKHRSVLAELQHTLQRVKDEKDAIQEEKAKQEGIMRDLQAQLSRIPTTRNAPPSPISPVRTPQERALSSYSRVNGLATKLPPPTPPPSIPPPPAPKPSTSSATSSAVLSPSSSRDSDIDSPATSVTPSATNGHASTVVADTEFAQQLQERTKQMEEQETIIKTLNKQLTHCEADLQAHMELVSNLETSLGDSEKNLRKARMQATELARERDSLNGQIESLRSELAEAKREVTLVRRSVVEEKQSLEQRLDEERRAKERVRHQLDARMDELSKRKSKFVCI